MTKTQNDIKKVLFVQSIPCIRTDKVAKAISEKGIQVDIIYLAAHPSDVYKDFKLPYKNIYQIRNINEMIEFVNKSDYDILYSSNEPDYLTVLFTASNKPVIHDTHDMMSLRGDITNEEMILEYIANVKSAGNIYVNPLIKEIAAERFNLKDKPILTLQSFIDKDQLPQNFYEKLSKKDGEIHSVFEGGLCSIPEHHRFLEPVFLNLAKNNIHVHIYGPVDHEYIKVLVSKSEFMHYEGITSPQNLIQEMTKYDIGLAVFNVTQRNKVFLDTAFPNKIWDYLGADLPILFADLLSFRKFADESGTGKILDINGNIKKQLKEVSNIKIDKDFLKNKKWLMNEAADDIIAFLSDVKERYYSMQEHLKSAL